MNTRFAVAVHILTILHAQNGAPATSEFIASSVNTNPSLIRRLLSQLGRAGLAMSQMGAGGGALLARPAHSITLLDVFRAVAAGRDMVPVHGASSPNCPVGRNIKAALEARIRDAEQALEASLSQTTIAALTLDVNRRERRRGARA